jgi:hypothetical protein
MAILLFLFVLLISICPLQAEMSTLQSKEAVILYEGQLEEVAKEVARIYPSVKGELAKTFHLKADFRPKVILSNDRNAFRKIVGSDIIIAFAVPDKNIIVLDTYRIYTKPFTLETTLKHELCHLFLHRNIAQERLPRWLDEGLCQWASGGIAELIISDEGRALAKATISDRLVPLRELEKFPIEEKSLILAYEQSKSIVEYVVSEFGSQKIIQILEYLKEGDSVNESIQKSLSISIFELEKNWHDHLKRKHTWFTYASNNLYTILFFLAAIITVYGFIRLLKKKKAYKDEEEEGENEETQ